MPSRGYKLAVAATLAALVCVVYADVKPKVYDTNVASLSTQEIEDQLQVCIAKTPPMCLIKS